MTLTRRKSVVLISQAWAICKPSAAEYVMTERGTLVLIGVGQDGIVLASDSGVFRDGNLVATGFRKIHPISRLGAAAVVGANQTFLLQNRGNGKELNAGRIIDEHSEPYGGFRATSLNLIQALEDAFAKLLAEPGAAAPKDVSSTLFSVYFAGYENDRVLLIAADFKWPREGKSEPRIKQQEIHPTAGFFQGFGKDRVAREVISGRSAAFTKFREDRAVRELKAKIAEQSTPSLRAGQLIGVARVCLEATESDEGHRFDRESRMVAEPNYYATISPQTGFSWRTPEG